MAAPPVSDDPASQNVDAFRRRRPLSGASSWSNAGVIIFAISVAIAALAGLSGVGVYFLRDKTASTPRPQTVTVTATPTASPGSDGADGLFLSTLATYGIADNGAVAVRQRFIEFGHHTCFSLLPLRPQPWDSAVNDILAAENQDVDAGDRLAPKFTHDDAEHLALAAIGAYCPNAPH